ncbi:hypothetical protein GT037_010942 [Alternaria burnsii]|uniref:Heterokaryon incompatibility domain-containing protein n=1 Tax=Alternaria burnsii TaxID=1187904 RepID=A0A8H7E8Z4_9PLEO|nr:uncharacterized protein GT037_010942 [Alternaria burnsii]KAF7670978.1 hypothetical protein GT037_010942 [Alternaria burnsii]
MAWHDATCATLDLEWEDGQPGCRKCERKAPKLAPVHPISPPAPPPDTPRSELICTWPPSLFSQGQAGGHGDSDTLAHILANIDEWTGTSSTRPSQRELKSDQQSPQQQPLNPSEPNSLFQGIYSRLPNANSIRLLRLHGSEDTSDPVCGTLENHRLHDPCRPIFEAFSYTWADSQGNSSLCETIFIGPQYDVLPVTKNCLAALRRFRTAIDRLVWVDAICINQFDLKERGHQVSLMKDIYTSAARVLIYLGDSDNGAESVIVLPQKNDQVSKDFSQSYTIDPREILQTPYFSRIWVIQEVMLSKAASVTHGNHTMHSEDLLSSVNTLFSTTRAQQPMHWVQHFNSIKIHESLYEVLLATKDCHCGDSRDRIYGLMGLVAEEEAERLPIDYNISVQQLYTGLALYWLTGSEDRSRSRRSELLKLALLPKATPLLPSWVPDWAPQLPTVASWERTLSTSSTFQFDTTLLRRPSGLHWSRSFDSSLIKRNERKSHWEWHTYPFSAPVPVEPFKLLPRSGVLALDAGHIFSTSMGKIELTDAHGKLLHGLQVASSRAFGLDQESFGEHDLHTYYLPNFEVAVVLKKHSDRVYSLHDLFCILSAPLNRQISPNLNDIINFHSYLVELEFHIVDDWLMNSFFYGVCAGSAYAHTRIRNDWSKHFPLASALCQASRLSFGMLYGELHKQSVLPVMMEICEDVLAFLDEDPVPKKSALLSRRWSDSFCPGDHYISSLGDADLADRVEEVLVTRKSETPSPQEMCTYLRNVVKGHQDSCKQCVPLQTALFDLKYDVNRLSMLVTIGKSPRHPIPLLLSDREIVPSQTADQTEQLYQITQAFIVWRARSLLSRLTIDPKFTLEQNFNILWIYVSTMDMVARLRGILQQRLILKAIQNKMMNRQKIHII